MTCREFVATSLDRERAGELSADGVAMSSPEGKALGDYALDLISGVAKAGLSITLVNPLVMHNLVRGRSIDLRLVDGGGFEAWAGGDLLGVVDRDYVSVYEPVDDAFWNGLLAEVVRAGAPATVEEVGEGAEGPFALVTLDLQGVQVPETPADVDMPVETAGLGDSGILSEVVEVVFGSDGPKSGPDPSSGPESVFEPEPQVAPEPEPESGPIVSSADPALEPAFVPDPEVVAEYRRKIDSLSGQVEIPVSLPDRTQEYDERTAVLEADLASMERELDGLGFFKRARKKELAASISDKRAEISRLRNERVDYLKAVAARECEIAEAVRRQAERGAERLNLEAELADYERGRHRDIELRRFCRVLRLLQRSRGLRGLID